MSIFNKKDPAVVLGRRGGQSTAAKYGRDHFVAAGKKGRAAVRKKHGPEFYKELSRKGVEARRLKREKKKKSGVDGVVDLLTGQA